MLIEVATVDGFDVASAIQGSNASAACIAALVSPTAAISHRSNTATATDAGTRA